MSEFCEILRITDAEEKVKNLDGVVFDLDDTLYSECDYVKSGYCAIAEAQTQVDSMAEKLYQQFLQKQNAIDTVLKNEGIYTEELKRHCLEIYREHKPKINLYFGVKEMLGRIKQSGKKLGLVTDGRPNGQRLKIEALGLGQLFDKIIITDELGGVECRKPNPLAFNRLQRDWDIPFDKMAYIGDRITKDFQAATAVGMNFIYFNNQFGLYRDEIAVEPYNEYGIPKRWM